MKQMKYFNSNEERKDSISHLTTEENLRVTDKTPKLGDAVSMIEDAGSSFVSGDLLEDFKQFGLETVEVHESSIWEDRLKGVERNFFYQGLERKRRTSEMIDNILDYSTFKELELKSKESKKREALALMKLKKLQKTLFENQANLIEEKANIENDLQNLKKLCVSIVEQFCISLVNDNINLKTNLQQKNEELQICKQNFKALNEENIQMKLEKKEKQNGHSRNSLEINKLKSIQNDIDNMAENKRLHDQFERECTQNSQMMKELNKEINELHNEVGKLKNENKNLKNYLFQSEKKLKDYEQANLIREDGKESKRMEIYHSFLEKIDILEKELTTLRESEKRKRIEQEEKEYKDQNQFLQNYHQKSVDLEKRESEINEKEEFDRRLSFAHNNSRRSIKPDRPSIGTPSSVKSIRSNSPSRKMTPIKENNANLNEKYYKFNMQRHSISHELTKSPSRFGNKAEMIKSYESQFKYSDEISSRIERIQNSIANELNTLNV